MSINDKKNFFKDICMSYLQKKICGKSRTKSVESIEGNKIFSSAALIQGNHIKAEI